ncbi:MAG: MFS transporter, partial [Flavobacteriales bacterium]|nr:MFS transporter [Flavobacteriales bacterium]
ANPYICRLGDEKSSSSRLNFTQGFNSLGATLAPLFGAAFIIGDTQINPERMSQLSEIQRIYLREEESQALLLPFLCLGIGLLVLSLILRHTNLPNTKLPKTDSNNVLEALRSKRLLLGAVGIFVYVGSEVAIGSYLHNYFVDNEIVGLLQTDSILGVWIARFYGGDIFQVNPKKVIGILVAIYWVGALIGRFIGSGIQAKVSPSRTLTVVGLGAITMLISAIYSHGLVAMWSILAVGLFNSIMFPTIFALSIEGTKENLGSASGILCTAIVGGAIIPLLFGSVIDSWGFQVAFMIPGICYLFIAYFGAWTYADSKKSSTEITESPQLEAIVQ